MHSRSIPNKIASVLSFLTSSIPNVPEHQPLDVSLSNSDDGKVGKRIDTLRKQQEATTYAVPFLHEEKVGRKGDKDYNSRD